MSTTTASIRKRAPAVKPALRPIGELVALFPEADPERFLQTFDQYALGMVRVKKAVLDRACPLPWPPRDPLRLQEWLAEHEVRIMAVKKLGEGRTYRRLIRYRLILGQEVQ